MTQPLRIGTRASALALAQANWVRSTLEGMHAGLEVELVRITTSGDRFTDRSLQSLGGKGLFVSEIETALQSRQIDLAVHSMKDLPAGLGDGLEIAVIPAREDPRDLLVSHHRLPLSALPPGSRIGTSSPRRAALLRSMRPDIDIVPLRGNVDTRLRKLRDGEIDAVVLAAAGCRRLHIDLDSPDFLDPTQFVPAIGQGALAIETRCGSSVGALLAALEHPPSRAAVVAERAFLSRAGGSCHTPMAAHATIAGDSLSLRALIASPDGRQIVRGMDHGTISAAAEMGDALAADLLGRGGAEILRSAADGPAGTGAAGKEPQG